MEPDTLGWRLNDLLERARMDGTALSTELRETQGVALSPQAISNLRTNTTKNPRPGTLQAIAKCFAHLGFPWATEAYLIYGHGGPPNEGEAPDGSDIDTSDAFLDRLVQDYNEGKFLGASDEDLEILHSAIVGIFRIRLRRAAGNNERLLRQLVRAAAEDRLRPSRTADSAPVKHRRKRRL